MLTLDVGLKIISGLYNKLGSLSFDAHSLIHSSTQSINIYVILSIILGLGVTAVDKTDKFLHLWKRALILSWGRPKIEINQCF